MKVIRDPNCSYGTLLSYFNGIVYFNDREPVVYLATPELFCQKQTFP